MTNGDGGRASEAEVCQFLEHALAVFESDAPADTHVVMAPEILDAIATYLELHMHADRSEYSAAMLPPQLSAYAEKYNGNKLRFSELCGVGLLADIIVTQSGAEELPQLCVPKYMLESLFHIIMSPAFAYAARRWFSVQDYQI